MSMARPGEAALVRASRFTSVAAAAPGVVRRVRAGR